jgi:hypothetical protein
MPTLRELQRGIRDALLADGDRAAAELDIVGDGLTPAARLAVYRHHVLASLTAALEATFPVVVRLVDPRFFRYAADRYVREHLPAGPCLFEFGASFPEFLGAFPPCRHLVYLPDVARLEWAMNVALHAPDAASLTADGLRALAAGAAGDISLGLQPSVTLLRSPWPIDRIWHANQPGASEDVVDLDAGGVSVQVWRRDDEVVFRVLTAAAFALRAALARDGRLGAAAAAARAADAHADLPALLGEAVDEGSLTT